MEAVLEGALFRAGLISPENHKDFSKSSWSRSSRTDKGVHSAASLVSLKAEFSPEFAVAISPGSSAPPATKTDPSLFEDAPDDVEQSSSSSSWDLMDVHRSRVNSFLPPTVRVHGMVRVPRGFMARNAVYARTYDYLVPQQLLLPPSSPTPLASAKQSLQRLMDIFIGTHNFHNFSSNGKPGPNAVPFSPFGPPPSTSAPSPRKLKEINKFRRNRHRGDDQANKGFTSNLPLDSVSQEYGRGIQEEDEQGPDEGNLPSPVTAESPPPGWLSGRSWGRFLVGDGLRTTFDPSLNRHIWSMTPIWHDTLKGKENLVTIRVVGQSFVYNQIRHMIGAILACQKGVYSTELIRLALNSPFRIPIPLAPPEPLVLIDIEMLKRSGVEFPSLIKDRAHDFFEQHLKKEMVDLLQNDSDEAFAKMWRTFELRASSVDLDLSDWRFKEWLKVDDERRSSAGPGTH